MLNIDVDKCQDTYDFRDWKFSARLKFALALVFKRKIVVLSRSSEFRINGKLISNKGGGE